MSDTGVPESPLILGLMEAGPGSRVLKRLRLHAPMSVKSATTFAVSLAVVTWLPLALLSLIEGDAFHGVAVPFIDDLAAHVRFLVALPILIWSEIPIGRRMRHSINHFIAAGLVKEKDVDAFGANIAAAMRLRDSRIAELILVALTALGCWVAVRKGLSAGDGTWYQPFDERYSLAGLWYIFVATPIFQFLLLRWIYRMLVWTRFLWGIARIDLNLTASHPDGAGGLMFLGKAFVPFGSIMFALSAVVSASAATRIMFAGGHLFAYWPIVVALIVLAVLIFVGPLLIFVPKLVALKHRGLAEYGVLGSRYTQAFQAKWVPGQPTDEPLLGTGDIQSLADLGNSYQMVRKMGVIPIDRSDLLAIALSVVVPALPLVATEVPLAIIGKQLLHLVI